MTLTEKSGAVGEALLDEIKNEAIRAGNTTDPSAHLSDLADAYRTVLAALRGE